MGQLGFQELLVIFIIALLVFGPKKLPELGKSLGKGLREFKRATNELKSSWDEQVRDAESELSSTAQDFKDIESDLRKDLDPIPKIEDLDATPKVDPDHSEDPTSPTAQDFKDIESDLRKDLDPIPKIEDLDATPKVDPDHSEDPTSPLENPTQKPSTQKPS